METKNIETRGASRSEHRGASGAGGEHGAEFGQLLGKLLGRYGEGALKEIKSLEALPSAEIASVEAVAVDATSTEAASEPVDVVPESSTEPRPELRDGANTSEQMPAESVQLNGSQPTLHDQGQEALQDQGQEALVGSCAAAVLTQASTAEKDAGEAKAMQSGCTNANDPVPTIVFSKEQNQTPGQQLPGTAITAADTKAKSETPTVLTSQQLTDKPAVQSEQAPAKRFTTNQPAAEQQLSAAAKSDTPAVNEATSQVLQVKKAAAAAQGGEAVVNPQPAREVGKPELPVLPSVSTNSDQSKHFGESSQRTNAQLQAAARAALVRDPAALQTTPGIRVQGGLNNSELAALGSPQSNAAAKNGIGKAVRELAHAQKTNPGEIVDKIKEMLESAAKSRNGTTLVVHLNPPELGALTLKVTQRADQIFARLTPESPVVEEAVRGHLQEITQIFTAQGIRQENVHISIGKDHGAESAFFRFTDAGSNQREQLFGGTRHQQGTEGERGALGERTSGQFEESTATTQGVAQGWVA